MSDRMNQEQAERKVRELRGIYSEALLVAGVCQLLAVSGGTLFCIGKGNDWEAAFQSAGLL